MALATRTQGGSQGSNRSYAPTQTLFCGHLTSQLRKEDIRRNLYMLFATYGTVLDITHVRTPKLRHTAHIVFKDVDGATRALRALNGFNFFGQELRLSYAKSKSDIISKLDGTFKIPTKETSEAEEQSNMTDLQKKVFGAGTVSATPKALQDKIPTSTLKATEGGDITKAPDAKPAEERAGTKRPREEESEQEDDDQEAAMDVSDSD